MLSHLDTGRNNSRVSDAEKEKHEHYDAVCASAGLSFKAFGLSTFGGAGPNANEIMNTISSKIVSKSGGQEGNILPREARERIIVACMRGVGAQLLSTFHMEEDDPAPHEWAEIPEEPCIEMAEDESREHEDRAPDAVGNPARLPLTSLTKLTPCGVYTDSVVIFRRPTHPPFWIRWRAFQNPIFSTSSVIP